MTGVRARTARGDRARTRHLLPIAALLLAACTPSPATPAPPADAVAPVTATEPDSDFPLRVSEPKDGDSFVASDGVEYRIGMVNTPERGECGAQQASERTYAVLAEGFAVDAYAQDTRGRSVARILTPQGDLGVLLAREGLADDRYLAGFRDENPEYARLLEDAFAAAAAARSGLHRTCWSDDTTAAIQAQPLTRSRARRAPPRSARVPAR